MVHKNTLLFLCALVACLSCADSMSAERPVNTASTENAELSVLLERVESIRQKHGVAAVGLSLVSRDKTLYIGGTGVLSWDADDQVSADTLFRLGSITKSFTGLTALSQQRSQNGLLEITANSVIPELLNADYGGATVTLDQLLEHTGGLSDLTQKEFAFQGERVTFEEAISIDPQSRFLKWPAGRHSSYSNAGYGYAGFMLEELSGEQFEKLVHRSVLQPLEMTTAGFFIDDKSPVLAAGYNTDGKTPIPYWHMIYRSFGGLNATPRDMSRFLRGLLQPPGKNALFKSLEERKRFENPSTTLAAGVGLEYGYGLGNYHWFSHGLRYHGHGGDADGYLSHYGYSNEAGLGYFVVITAFNKKPLNELRDEIEAYFADIAQARNKSYQEKTDEPVTMKLDTKVLEALTGSYRAVTRRFGSLDTNAEPTLEVRIKNGQLETRVGRTVRRLVAVTQNTFRRPWQPDATYAFVTTTSGDLYLQGDIGNFKRVD